MNTGIAKRLYTILFFLAFFSSDIEAQVVDNTMHLDTLKMANRVSLRTNGVDWLLLLPNFGVEVDVRNNNWSRWSVALNGKYNWRTSQTFDHPMVWDLKSFRIDVRNYWRTRKIDGRAVKAHTHWYDRLFSQRRYAQRHPLTTYYRGFFLAYDDYAYRIKLSEDGKQGKSIIGGVSYGIVRPIYKFPDGTSIDVDFGLSLGWGVEKFSRFTFDKETSKYVVTQNNTKWQLMRYPVVHELRAGLVYRIGRKSVYEKHRFRYDVDAVYRAKVDSMVDANAHKMYIDSINTDQYRRVYDFFQQQIDSLQKTMPMTKDMKKQQRQFRPLNRKEGGRK